MAGNIFVKSRPLWDRAFVLLRRGNKRLAHVSVGLFIGAILAAYVVTGFQSRRISYDASPLSIKVTFWLAGAGFLLWLLFSPGKFRTWRSPFGFTPLDTAQDWAVFLGSIVASCALTVALSAFLA